MRAVPLVFALALVARLVAQLALGAYVHPETWEYEDIANNILAGRGYTYEAGTTYVASVSSPLYVLLTAGLYLLTAHNQAAMLVVQAVWGAATAALAGWLGHRLFGPAAALASGLLVAVDPGLVVYSAKLHSLSLDALAFVAVACVTVALPVSPSWRWAGLLGLLLGLAALSRTTALILLPVCIGWLRRFRRLRLRSAAGVALVGAALVVYSPWPIRNSLLLSQFVPGSSEATEWLWRGNNPAASGSSWTADGRTMLEVAPPEFQSRVAGASEAERIGIYRDAALDFMRGHPAQAAGLYAAKLKAFWWGSESTGILYPPGWVLTYDAWYVAVLALAAWGCWRGLREPTARPGVWLVLAVLALISLSQAVFYVEGRHRLAIEPLVLVLSGGALARRLAQYSTFGVRALGRLIVGLCITALVAMFMVATSMQLIADDLHAEVTLERGGSLNQPRNPIGTWLAARMRSGADEPAADRERQADQLSQRADRIREGTGVVALLGLLGALVTERSARGVRRPLARTSNNGTV